jgi:hypothetical protein
MSRWHRWVRLCSVAWFRAGELAHAADICARFLRKDPRSATDCAAVTAALARLGARLGSSRLMIVGSLVAVAPSCTVFNGLTIREDAGAPDSASPSAGAQGFDASACGCADSVALCEGFEAILGPA